MTKKTKKPATKKAKAKAFRRTVKAWRKALAILAKK